MKLMTFVQSSSCSKKRKNKASILVLASAVAKQQGISLKTRKIQQERVLGLAHTTIWNLKPTCLTVDYFTVLSK